jgi:hypothetical protein
MSEIEVIGYAFGITILIVIFFSWVVGDDK